MLCRQLSAIAFACICLNGLPTAACAADKPAKPSSVTKALFVKLKAKPGKEAEVAKLLAEAQAAVGQEPATALWFALRFDNSTFGIFDASPDEAGRQAHLAGAVAANLVAKSPSLLVEPPVIEKADIIAKKVNKD